MALSGVRFELKILKFFVILYLFTTKKCLMGVLIGCLHIIEVKVFSWICLIRTDDMIPLIFKIDFINLSHYHVITFNVTCIVCSGLLGMMTDLSRYEIYQLTDSRALDNLFIVGVGRSHMVRWHVKLLFYYSLTGFFIVLAQV